MELVDSGDIMHCGRRGGGVCLQGKLSRHVFRFSCLIVICSSLFYLHFQAIGVLLCLSVFHYFIKIKFNRQEGKSTRTTRHNGAREWADNGKSSE